MTKEAFLDCFKDNEKEYGKYGLILADPDHAEIAKVSSLKIFFRHLETFYHLTEDEKKILKAKSRSFRAFFDRMQGRTEKEEKKGTKGKGNAKKAPFQFTKQAFEKPSSGLTFK